MAFGKSKADKAKKQRPARKRRVKRPHPIKAIKKKLPIIGRVLLVLLALAVCIVPAIFVNNAIGYVPLFAFVVLLIVSFVYLRVLIWGFSYSEDSLLPSCERGSEIDFVVNFKNKSPLVFVRLEPHFYISDLFGDVDVQIPASMTLMPFEDRDFRFGASFDHIGTYSAGVSKIVISDLLGLFSHTIVNPDRHTVEVLPRLFDVSRVDLANVSVQESRKAFQPIVTDDMDYAGVRAYEPGDPLKTIHWKLSSRNTEGDYFTRLFETFSNPGLAVILDTTAPDYDKDSLMFVFDGLVESALSINDYAHQQGIDSQLVYKDIHNETRRTRILELTDFDSLVKDLPRINVAEDHEAIELLRREGNSIHGQDNIAYCTSHLSEELISMLVEMKMRKRNPILFLILPPHMDSDEEKEFTRPLRRLDSADVVYYAVSSAADLSKEEPR